MHVQYWIGLEGELMGILGKYIHSVSVSVSLSHWEGKPLLLEVNLKVPPDGVRWVELQPMEQPWQIWEPRLKQQWRKWLLIVIFPLTVGVLRPFRQWWKLSTVGISPSVMEICPIDDCSAVHVSRGLGKVEVLLRQTIVKRFQRWAALIYSLVRFY